MVVRQLEIGNGQRGIEDVGDLPGVDRVHLQEIAFAEGLFVVDGGGFGVAQPRGDAHRTLWRWRNLRHLIAVHGPHITPVDQHGGAGVDSECGEHLECRLSTEQTKSGERLGSPKISSGCSNPAPLKVGCGRILLWQKRCHRNRIGRQGGLDLVVLPGVHGVFAELPGCENRQRQIGEPHHNQGQRDPARPKQERQPPHQSGASSRSSTHP